MLSYLERNHSFTDLDRTKASRPDGHGRFTLTAQDKLKTRNVTIDPKDRYPIIISKLHVVYVGPDHPSQAQHCGSQTGSTVRAASNALGAAPADAK
mgnify:CR=1 FL=1